jgi:hypothetical protein
MTKKWQAIYSALEQTCPQLRTHAKKFVNEKIWEITYDMIWFEEIEQSLLRAMDIKYE